jgi:IS30 family transposase
MSTERVPWQRYTAEQKAAFFALFDELQSNSETARRLGLNLNSTYRWLRDAGLTPNGLRGPGYHPGRARYAELRASGVSRREAAATVGVHYRTASDWDKGARHSRNRRYYADGRVVDYTTGMTTYVAQSERAGWPRIENLQRDLHPRLLSLEERERISDLVRSGSSVRQIAKVLSRAPSTISREIRRNSASTGYHPYTAHRTAAKRRPRPKARKLVACQRLRDYVQDKLTARWSPEQISHSLMVEFPADLEMRVTHETIYQTLYLQGRGQLRRELTVALRTGRAMRVPHRHSQRRKPRFTDPMVMISERPAEIADRAVPGHWEGDLIIGKNLGSQIGTLVERTTRYLMLVHLPGTRDAATVRDALSQTMADLPAHLRRSLTWDQGAELAEHKQFRIETGIPVFFCDPASPWQRGSNENTNGLLRQYFPKGTDLSVHSADDLAHVAHALNSRPRKTLDWQTPAQRLAAFIDVA